MKMYRTSAWDYVIEEHEVVKKTDKKVTFLDIYMDYQEQRPKTREQRESLHTSYRDWHETKSDAENFLLKRIDSNIKYAEDKIAQLKIERQKLVDNSE